MQARGAALRVELRARRHELPQPVIEGLRADAGERGQVAGDRGVGAAGGGHALGHVGPVDAHERFAQSLRVLPARAQQQRPVDVEQQQHEPILAVRCRGRSIRRPLRAHR